jgi:hypothetical protein
VASLVGLAVFCVAIGAVLVLGIALGVRAVRVDRDQFHAEVEPLGFRASPAPGRLGRSHLVGEWAGRPAVVGYYPGAGNVESDAAGEVGVLVAVSLGDAPPPSGIEVWPAERIGRGSTLDLVIRASWPEGWQGAVGRALLPLHADRAEIRRALDTLTAPAGR